LLNDEYVVLLDGIETWTSNMLELIYSLYFIG